MGTTQSCPFADWPDIGRSEAYVITGVSKRVSFNEVSILKEASG
jgi:hypothetical protein